MEKAGTGRLERNHRLHASVVLVLAHRNYLPVLERQLASIERLREGLQLGSRIAGLFLGVPRHEIGARHRRRVDRLAGGRRLVGHDCRVPKLEEHEEVGVIVDASLEDLDLRPLVKLLHKLGRRGIRERGVNGESRMEKAGTGRLERNRRRHAPVVLVLAHRNDLPVLERQLPPLERLRQGLQLGLRIAGLLLGVPRHEIGTRHRRRINRKTSHTANQCQGNHRLFHSYTPYCLHGQMQLL